MAENPAALAQQVVDVKKIIIGMHKAVTTHAQHRDALLAAHPTMPEQMKLRLHKTYGAAIDRLQKKSRELNHQLQKLDPSFVANTHVRGFDAPAK